MQNNTFFGYNHCSTLIVLDKISSTNDYAKQLLSNFKPQLQFTAIMAKEQTQGRGQRDAKWIAEANENLTASFIFKPKNIKIEDQFLITIISSLATYDIIKYFCNENVFIKWPNDIILNNKKIGGILIENKIDSRGIKSSVIGIGINLLSKAFPTEIASKTTSLALENFEVNLTMLDLVKMIQQRLAHYDKMRIDDRIEDLWNSYQNLLYQKDRNCNYIINNKQVEGCITGVNKDGKLALKIEESIETFDLKSIQFLY